MVWECILLLFFLFPVAHYIVVEKKLFTVWQWNHILVEEVSSVISFRNCVIIKNLSLYSALYVLCVCIYICIFKTNSNNYLSFFLGCFLFNPGEGFTQQVCIYIWKVCFCVHICMYKSCGHWLGCKDTSYLESCEASK